MSKKKHVCGYRSAAGLSAATHLARHLVVSVTLLEKNGIPLVVEQKVSKHPGVCFDMGPSWYWTAGCI